MIPWSMKHDEYDQIFPQIDFKNILEKMAIFETAALGRLQLIDRSKLEQKT